MTTPSQQTIEAIAEKWVNECIYIGERERAISLNSIKSAITEANVELLKRVEELEYFLPLARTCAELAKKDSMAYHKFDNAIKGIKKTK